MSMFSPTRTKVLFSQTIGALALGGVLLCSAHARASDAEPVDPAEYRPQLAPPDLRQMPERGSISLGGPWISRGPAPTRSAQVRVPPDNEVSGAIHAVLPHPTDANILYIGAVNGGVWRTQNALAARPSWTPLTEALPSQSIGALAFDRLDASRQTVLAGTGRWSNFAQRGDDEVGVYRTTNGGTSWQVLGGSTLLGQKLIAVAARGSTLFAASAIGGLFRSDDTGANWALSSGTGGLPTGAIGALAEDPANANRLAVAVRGTTPAIMRSDDLGASWINVSAGVANLSGNSSFRLDFGPDSTLFLAVINGGVLNGVYRSANLGVNWTALDVPSVHPGGQGAVNTALAADRTNNNVVFVSGDRITAGPFTANIARIDASQASGAQIATVVDAGANNTAPHADSRDLRFAADGSLLESDDGGVYRLVNPNAGTRVWQSVIGDLNVMEVHNVAQDSITRVLMIGTQDNGTHQQNTADSRVWALINGGDGGDVAINSTTLGPVSSQRFLSSQNLGGFRRASYSAANAFISSLTMPTLSVAGDVQFVTPIELNIANDQRLLIGGLNNLYESTNADSGAPSYTVLGAPGANRQAVAYGSTVNPDVIYVGKNTAVFKRASAGGAITQTAALPAGAAAITDVAINRTNDNEVFACDDNQVFRSTNGGTSWTDITGNLASISAQDFRTVEFINDPGNQFGGSRIAVGTRSGVYTALSNSTTWERLGGSASQGMPDVLVFDLRYYPAQRLLTAGTLGRGVYTFVFGADIIFTNDFE